MMYLLIDLQQEYNTKFPQKVDNISIRFIFPVWPMTALDMNEPHKNIVDSQH